METLYLIGVLVVFVGVMYELHKRLNFLHDELLVSQKMIVNEILWHSCVAVVGAMLWPVLLAIAVVYAGVRYGLFPLFDRVNAFRTRNEEEA